MLDIGDLMLQDQRHFQRITTQKLIRSRSLIGYLRLILIGLGRHQTNHLTEIRCGISQQIQGKIHDN